MTYNEFNRNMGCIEMASILVRFLPPLRLIETWDVLKCLRCS